MSDAKVVYVVGSGSVGTALAACLVSEGRRAVAVHTRNVDAPLDKGHGDSALRCRPH